MKIKHSSISKIKQITHAYLPLLLLLFLPKGWTAVTIVLLYVFFAGYFYLKKVELKETAENYEYFMFNLLPILIILGGYVNGL